MPPSNTVSPGFTSWKFKFCLSCTSPPCSCRHNPAHDVKYKVWLNAVAWLLCVSGTSAEVTRFGGFWGFFFVLC